MKMLLDFSIKNNRGYTIVELMVSVVVGLMLIAAATATYITQNRSFTAQEGVSEVNTQSKIAHDLVTNAIRSSGFGTPLDMNVDNINGETTIISLNDGGTTGPDSITVVGGFKKVGELWPDPVPASPTCDATTTTVVPMGATSVQIIYEPDIDANEGFHSTVSEGRQHLSIDGIDFALVTGCESIVDGNCAGSISLSKAMSQNFPLVDTTGNGLCDTGRPVYLVEDVTYCIDTANFTLNRIRRNADAVNCAVGTGSVNEVLAENIEDFQLAYAREDDDGNVDVGLGDANKLDADDFVDGVNNSDVFNDSIRAVRVNVLAATSRPDPTFTNMGDRPGSIENRITYPSPPYSAVPDDLRRRWWQTVVTVRNK
jgi:prepilin-type N-terminal cleavage/methylation domain-containing protein